MGSISELERNTSAFRFLLFILLWALCFSEGSGSGNLSHFHEVEVISLLPKQFCSASKDNSRDRNSRLTVFHRHGPCWPSARGGSGVSVTLTELLEGDRFRVEWLQSQISGELPSTVASAHPEQANVPARSGRPLSTGNFIVSVGFGTPRKDMSLIFDTGSDLTWIQCQPCTRSCYPQQEKVFDPAESSTYANASCSSAECTQVSSATGNQARCSSSTCVYGIQYGDQSYSIGFLAHETITLASDSFKGLVFGCGQNNEGLFGKTAGLLGLGRNRVSFVSQTAGMYKKIFSYCLPATPSSTGYLNFGGYKSNSAAPLQFTPMLKNSANPSFYFLDLLGISVGGTKLPISSSVFSAGGTLIDSGTVITRLPPDAYSALRSSFQQAMSRYPTAPAVSILDTCYDLSGYESFTVPKVSLQFRGGTTVSLDASGILLVASKSQVCLAFAKNRDAGSLTIVGNKQQQTIQVVYDVARARIGFGAGGCS